jgi:hypothetical protein
MSKRLIVEYMPFKPVSSLTEQSGAEYGIPGGFVVQGVLQRAGAKNQNGRVYPRNILERECRRYQQEYIDQHRALGELDHPESSVVNLKNVSHNIVDMGWDGKDLVGTIEILPTPSGNILRDLLQSGILLGISSRGLGSVKKDMRENADVVQDDFDLIAFDFVSNPSTQGAFMYPQGKINESVEQKIIINPYSNVERIIHNILSEL